MSSNFVASVMQLKQEASSVGEHHYSTTSVEMRANEKERESRHSTAAGHGLYDNGAAFLQRISLWLL